MKRIALSSRFAGIFMVLSILAISPAMLVGPSSQADNGPNHRVRNLRFGVSGGNVRDATSQFCCSGTLGALLRDTNGTQFILSNNHVLGRSGAAVAGDDVSQPGLIDNGCRIATVVADFTVAPALGSNVDAAIAQLRPGTMDGTGFIEDIGTISSVVRAPAVGLAVQKSGRTTGHTTGTISSINTTVSVRYGGCGSTTGPIFTFTNQVVVGSSSFSAGGDSGSLIVTRGACERPVALLFAGSSSATIGNPIGQVLSRISASLGRTVSFVGSTCTAARFEPEVDLPGIAEEAVARASRVKERNENRIMSKPSVIGFGISSADDNAGEPILVVYVDETTGRRPNLPKKLGGLRVKVVYTDTFTAL